MKILTIVTFLTVSISSAAYEDPFEFDKNENRKQAYSLAIPESKSLIGNTLFHFWDKHLTKLDGAPCPMYPTCSHFFRLVVEKEGISKAVVKTLARILKETPDMGSYDEYPLILKHGRYRFFDPIENYDVENNHLMCHSREGGNPEQNCFTGSPPSRG